MKKRIYKDTNGITRVRRARQNIEKQNAKMRGFKSRKTILRENAQTDRNMTEAINRARSQKRDLSYFLRTTRIKREKVGKKFYWVIRSPKNNKIVDKTPAKGVNKMQAWQSFNKQARRFDNGNIVFAQDIGMAKDKRAKGLMVRQYVTKNPDKRFGHKVVAQYKGQARVVLTREFQKKYKTGTRIVQIRGVEGYSDARGGLSWRAKQEQAKRRWKAGVFLELKRKFGIDGSTDLSYELVEIIPVNDTTRSVYTVYEQP